MVSLSNHCLQIPILSSGMAYAHPSASPIPSRLSILVGAQDERLRRCLSPTLTVIPINRDLGRSSPITIDCGGMCALTLTLSHAWEKGLSLPVIPNNWIPRNGNSGFLPPSFQRRLESSLVAPTNHHPIRKSWILAFARMTVE